MTASGTYRNLEQIKIVSSRLATLETFPLPTEAGFVKNMLEAEGIHAYLADESTVGTMSYLSNAMGWVKIQVAEDDLSRANEILETHRQTVADLGPDVFIAEATSTSDTDAVANDPECSLTGNEPEDDDIVDPMNELAWRALRAAVFGVICSPFAFYSAWLIGRLIFSKSELSPAATWKLWLSFALTVFVFFAVGMFIWIAPF